MGSLGSISSLLRVLPTHRRNCAATTGAGAELSSLIHFDIPNHNAGGEKVNRKDKMGRQRYHSGREGLEVQLRIEVFGVLRLLLERANDGPGPDGCAASPSSPSGGRGPVSRSRDTLRVFPSGIADTQGRFRRHVLQVLTEGYEREVRKRSGSRLLRRCRRWSQACASES